VTDILPLAKKSAQFEETNNTKKKIMCSMVQKLKGFKKKIWPLSAISLLKISYFLKKYSLLAAILNL
jgi:hypothetical protein